MRPRPMLALLALVLLAALIGCGKGKKTGTDSPTLDEQSETTPTGKTGSDLPPPPATYPDTPGGKVAKALDEAAATAEKLGDWAKPLDALEKSLQTEIAPETGAPKGHAAKAERAIIDAGFERLWRATRKKPELEREQFVHAHGEHYVNNKLGTYEQGRARGDSVAKPVPPAGRITSPSDRVPEASWVEVDAASGTNAKWSRDGWTWFSGRVQFSGKLELVINGNLGVKFSGSANEIALMASGMGSRILADLSELTAGTVLPPATTQGLLDRGNTAFVRVGSGVKKVHYGALGYRGLLLVRDNPGIAVTGAVDNKPPWPTSPKNAFVALIRY